MIYKSFSGVENVIPYPIHIDVATEFIITVHAFKKL